MNCIHIDNSKFKKVLIFTFVEIIEIKKKVFVWKVLDNFVLTKKFFSKICLINNWVYARDLVVAWRFLYLVSQIKLIQEKL
jgi:hypothetical protein